MIMNSSKNVKWIIPFKKFSMVTGKIKALFDISFQFDNSMSQVTGEKDLNHPLVNNSFWIDCTSLLELWTKAHIRTKFSTHRTKAQSCHKRKITDLLLLLNIKRKKNNKRKKCCNRINFSYCSK